MLTSKPRLEPQVNMQRLVERLSQAYELSAYPPSHCREEAKTKPQGCTEADVEWDKYCAIRQTWYLWVLKWPSLPHPRGGTTRN